MIQPGVHNKLSWTVGDAELSAPILTACLEAAIAAPSIHNSQPWRFRIRDGGIDVFTDPTRRLAVIDPEGRELMVSVGAALLNLRVAFLHHGRMPVLRLLPEDGEPHLVARVEPGPPAEPDETVVALAAAIPRRRTNRHPFRDVPVPGTVIDELRAAAAVEGARLSVADPVGRDAILALVETANGWQQAEAGYRKELNDWTSQSGTRRDGIPVQAFGPHDERERLPLRDFGITLPEVHRRQARFETHPTIVVLTTETDDTLAWLRTGQALERVLLTATVRGVASTAMTAALEIPELRALLGDPAKKRIPQVILRLGYGRPAAPSPRRPLSDVLLPE